MTSNQSVDARLERIEIAVARLNESVELVAQLLAEGKNIGRLERRVSKLSDIDHMSRVGHRLIEIVRQMQTERAA